MRCECFVVWFTMSTKNERESSRGDQGQAENPASSSGYSSNPADLTLAIAASPEAMDTLSMALAGPLAAAPLASALGAGQYRPWKGVSTLAGPRGGRVLRDIFPRRLFSEPLASREFSAETVLSRTLPTGGDHPTLAALCSAQSAGRYSPVSDPSVSNSSSRSGEAQQMDNAEEDDEDTQLTFITPWRLMRTSCQLPRLQPSSSKK